MILYENYNISYNFSPHFEAHESYVSNIIVDSCGKLSNIPYDERCKYIHEVEKCTEDMSFVNYMEIMFCTLDPSSFYSTIAASIFFLFIAILHFYILSEISDKFFCPTLSMVSKYFHLNDVLAGTTLLAFGNGSSDLITSITQLDKRSDLTYSELTGACVFVTTIVTSGIILANPFQIQACNITRDILVLIITMLYIDLLVFFDIDIWKSIGLFIIYIIYVCIVITDAFLQERQIKVLVIEKKLPEVQTVESLSGMDRSNDPTVCEQFFQSFKPFTKMTPFDIIVSPIMLTVYIIVPEVNTEPDRGWSKLLNCLQIMITPAMLTTFLVLGSCDQQCWGYSLIKGAWTLTITLPLAAIVYNTTTTKKPPKLHCLFSVLSLFASMFYIYLVAVELINILQVLGRITGLSEGYLGCTFLSYGFSVGDLVANTSFARRGNSEMALAACFAGPIFNVLISLGVLTTYQCLTIGKNEPPPKLLQGDQGVNCAFFLVMIQSLFLLGLTFTNFYARRSLAFYLIFSYIIFLAFSTMSELEVIHPFGNYHLKSS